jgi:hypothetical protein
MPKRFYSSEIHLLADFNGPNEFGMSARLIDRKNGQKLADVLFDIIR